MLTLSRTSAPIEKPERERITFILNHGNGRTERLTVPANRNREPEPAPEFIIPARGFDDPRMNVPAGFVDFFAIDGTAWRVRRGYFQERTPADECAPLCRHDLAERERVCDSSGIESTGPEPGEPVPPVVIETEPQPEPGSAFYVTTAQVDYDGFGTRTIRENYGRSQLGKVWRLIQIQDSAFEWQNGRNGSGLHATIPRSQFDELRHVFCEPEPAPVVASPEPAPAPVAVETVSPEPATVPAVADSLESDFLVRSNAAIAERQERERVEREQFAEFDWTSNPNKWKPEHVRHYLEHVCGVNLTAEDKTGTDFVNFQNKERAESLFRQHNRQTATVHVNRSTFLASLKNAKKFGGSRGANKTVSLCVNGSVDLVCVNQDSRFSQAVSYLEKRGELALTFPEVRLSDIANKLKADSLQLILNAVPVLDEFALTIKTDSAEFTLPVQSADDSGRFSGEFPAEYCHNVPAGELLSAIRQTEFATDNETSRYALGGLFVVPGSDSLEIAATDSRRLSWKRIPAEVLGTLPEPGKSGTYQSRGVVIPSAVFSLLSDELKRLKSDCVVSFAVAQVVTSRTELKPPETTTGAKPRKNAKPAEPWQPEPATETGTRNVCDDSGIWFRESFRTEFVFELPGAFSVRGVPVDGRFPRYRDVVPRSFSSAFTLNRSAFLNSVETILLSTSEDSRGVDFEFPRAVQSPLVLRANSSKFGKANVSQACERVDTFADGPIVVTLDPKYLIDFLKRCESDSVRFSLNDSDSPVLIQAEHEFCSDDSGGYVIMPLLKDR